MKTNNENAPEALTTALFQIFVFIADTEGGLTSRDVERLNKLLADTSWVEDNSVREALAQLGSHYTALWKAYDAGSITREYGVDDGADANDEADIEGEVTRLGALVRPSGAEAQAVRNHQQAQGKSDATDDKFHIAVRYRAG